MGKTADTGDPTEAFKALTKKAQSIGLSPQQIAQVDAVRQLRAPNKTWLKVRELFQPILWPMVVSWLLLLMIFTAVWLIEWPVSRKTLLTPYFEFMQSDIEREPCFAEMPELIADITRPPAECGFCRDVVSVEKVSGITPEEFEAKYAYSGRPLVVLDAMANWTAVEKFSFDFFRSIYLQDSPTLLSVEQNCQFFPYQTEFSSLGEVFNMSADRAAMKGDSKPWYIGWSNCDSSAANSLREHYQKPYFLPQLAETSKTDWIFMGSPGYGAHMHIDSVGNPSWQAQIKGIKLWTLEPPPECYHECTAHKIEVTVNPGEIIVLDTNIWYHSTLILGEEMSIVITTEYD